MYSLGWGYLLAHAPLAYARWRLAWAATASFFSGLICLGRQGSDTSKRSGSYYGMCSCTGTVHYVKLIR
jgi:hypothetical protein